MGYGPWGCKESEPTEATEHTHITVDTHGCFISVNELWSKKQENLIQIKTRVSFLL